MLLDTGFRPSADGFGFANTWQDMLLGALPSRGRCGGMVFAALDYFVAGVPLPPEARTRTLPANDSPLGRLIWRRQLASVADLPDRNLARFVQYSYLPATAPLGVEAATRKALLTLFDLLRTGRPAPLGMVSRLGLPQIATNHQVLAYAAEFGDVLVKVRVYDPNHPRRDDITLVVPLSGGPVIEMAGERRVHEWRGFFIEQYTPRTPR